MGMQDPKEKEKEEAKEKSKKEMVKRQRVFKENLKNPILDAIGSGQTKKTTVKILGFSEINSRYSQNDFLFDFLGLMPPDDIYGDLLLEKEKMKMSLSSVGIDFLYLPSIPTKKMGPCLLGNAFINFRSPNDLAKAFHNSFSIWNKSNV